MRESLSATKSEWLCIILLTSVLKCVFKPAREGEKAENNSDGILICERRLDRKGRLLQPGLMGKSVPATNTLRKMLST